VSGGTDIRGGAFAEAPADRNDWRPSREKRPRLAFGIAAFFGDLTLLAPGLVDVCDWRPDSAVVTTSSDVLALLGGVARKD
jgi:S-adenosyl methyltransferase